VLAHLSQFALQVGEFLGIGRNSEKAGDNKAAAGASPMATHRHTRAGGPRFTETNHQALLEVVMSRRLLAARRNDGSGLSRNRGWWWSALLCGREMTPRQDLGLPRGMDPFRF
jgi:hypothetical protein